MKLGILGCGHIATKMAKAVKTLEAKNMGVELYAAAARDLKKAQDFAAQYGVAKAYGCYQELAADPEVNLIYIATPHSHHYEHAKLCIAAGKNILVEKAFCANAKQASEIISLAHDRGTFLCEAMWTRFLPAVDTIRNWIAAGRIGEVQYVEADFSMPLTHVDRLVNPALAGGALLDLGIYSLTFADLFLNDESSLSLPKGGSAALTDLDVALTDLDARCIKWETGVDATDWITITYKNGKRAYLKTSITSPTHNEGTIYGTAGYIKVQNLNDMRELQVYDAAGLLVETLKPEPICNFYEYEVLACARALSNGSAALTDLNTSLTGLQCPEMPHSKTMEMMELMDSIRERFDQKA